MWMFRLWLQGHQVYDVYHSYPEFGNMAAQQIDRCQGFERRHIARASHYHIRLTVLVIACPTPDPDTRSAVLNGRVHIEPLQGWLFSGDDNVN